MTTIAWDGKTLAADKQSTSHDMGRTVTKIFRLSDGLLALCGGGVHASAIRDWFMGERNPATWPRLNTEDNAGSVIHITDDGIFVYNGQLMPTPEKLEDRFIAFGTGRDYAMAAMHLGENATTAVRVACEYDIYSGQGVNSLSLNP